MSCCTGGLQIFSDWVIPEGILQRTQCSRNFYRNNPIMSRVIATPMALLSGTVKPLLIPVMCAVGAVSLPVIALTRVCCGKNDAGDWLKAWAFCLLGLAATAAFLAVTCYHLPLVASAGLFVGILATSITIHVYKLLKEPN